jgi:hypothetical protein
MSSKPSSANLKNGTYLETPDGRYFIIKGRLWRKSNPALLPARRQDLVDDLMDIRQLKADRKSLNDARRRVGAAKRAFGERGPVWWNDGAPDFNRRLVKNTSYAIWYAASLKDGLSGEEAPG